jgi:hypothetical protein
MQRTTQATMQATVTQAKSDLSSATTTNQYQHLLLYKHVLLTGPPAITTHHTTPQSDPLSHA